MITNSVVALDIDGILLDFEGHWTDCARRVLDWPDLKKLNESYQLHDRYGLPKADAHHVWDTFHHEVQWANVPLYDHARDLVYALEDMGCQVWAVTSIRAEFHQARVDSLCGLLPVGRVICVDPHHAPIEKVAALHRIGAVAFLDDHPDNANAAASVVGLSALLDRRYTGLEVPTSDVVVIDDPMDYPVLVETMLRRTRLVD
ncbi:HAD family hydrolase [Acidithiobacillus sp.]|uniref:HAD family hydrolase n=1 Tax=Acidithiobacillus sp. TaxID=1872118 RepID=UPI00262C8251|nr:HAD family hydrolase [Acidithiobacillus sp.]MDD5279534.1 hypothetical protein [Acidithiobacillus sp.]